MSQNKLALNLNQTLLHIVRIESFVDKAFRQRNQHLKYQQTFILTRANIHFMGSVDILCYESCKTIFSLRVVNLWDEWFLRAPADKKKHETEHI